jgi:hypothetical protein
LDGISTDDYLKGPTAASSALHSVSALNQKKKKLLNHFRSYFTRKHAKSSDGIKMRTTLVQDEFNLGRFNYNNAAQYKDKIYI